MAKFETIKSKVYVLPLDNIDTDQIIPARYLKATSKSGLGEALFSDKRRLPDGSPRPDFPTNKPELQGAQVLVAGANFGCGSSREHAPWALVDFGLRAVLATSFADIFRNNALKNGLLPVQLEPAVQQDLLEQLSKDPLAQVEIDLVNECIRLPDGKLVAFSTNSFARLCLLNGVDELGYILGFGEQIEAYEARRSQDPC